MKKFGFVVLLILIGVGAYYGWKMFMGDGGWRGWIGESDDPWNAYQVPEEEQKEAAAAETQPAS